MLYVMVANYANKHITFSKGQCIGYMEPPIDRISQTSGNSFMAQKMMDNQVSMGDLHTPLYIASPQK